MPPAKQRTPEMRDHLLDVALFTLATEGVMGLTARRVAERASTSPPAIYELFGDKAGLVRAVFFAGFERLGDALGELPTTDDPVADLRTTAAGFRRFATQNEVLAEVMFARPFADFDPAPEEGRAGARVRDHIVARVRAGIDAGVLGGDAVDVAHALLALVLGLAAAERAQRLGTSRRSVDRRWASAVDALLRGFAPA